MKRAILVLSVVLVAGTCLAVGSGEILGWGLDDCGQASPPGTMDFVSIDAASGGGDHRLALRTDGSIW